MIDVKKITRTVGLLIVSVGLAACAGQFMKPEKTEAELKEAPGTILIMLEREAGSPEFTSRLFINEGYLHLSDARSPADFVLFNRREQTIYNVNQADKTIMVIRNKPVEVESPIELDYQEESQPSAAIPKIEGKAATHYRYVANGKHCYDAVVMPKDFLPDVVAAMREFRQVLAGEHATTVDQIPRDVLDACDLSLNIFHATKHMEHGLPIREWDRHGYQRFLKDYRTGVQADVGTFDLPKDFERYSVGDVLVQVPDTESDAEAESKTTPASD
jgi:hypothetical protein